MCRAQVTTWTSALMVNEQVQKHWPEKNDDQGLRVLRNVDLVHSTR